MASKFGILIFVILLLPTLIFSQTLNEIRKAKEKSEKEIVYLNKLLNEAKADKSVSIEKLNILQQKILQSRKLLHSLNQEVNYLQSLISSNEKRIAELHTEKKSMLDLYAKLIYGTWKKRNKTEKLMFIFSASDFNQAYNRFKYFQQIQEYSKRQLYLINQVNDSLKLKNNTLKNLIVEKSVVLDTITTKNKELQIEQNKENSYIRELEKKEKEIKIKLQTETKNRQKFANELNKLIARQAKQSGSSSTTYKLTPEEKLVSNDFVKNKGKLPWPVEKGFISDRFGIKTHPVYKKIQTINNGIDITTSKNANVRAVFNGIVSEVLFFSGLGNVVIIRHGNYITVYPNLIDITVRKGQKVNTKDIIGKLAYDEEKGSVLNFQIWKDMEKLNPQLWLAK